MKRTTSWLRRLLPESPGLWLLAAVISLALWAFVHIEQPQITTVEVPLNLTEPADKVLVTDAPEKIKVTISGPWTQIQGLDRDELAHNIDLSGFDVGPSVYYLDPESLELPPRTRALRVSPSQLRLSFARKVTRQVPVVPNLVGQPAKDHEIKGFSCVPSLVAIEGAESEVALLDEILTEKIDLVQRTQTFETDVGLFPLSRNVWLKEKIRFRVRVEIEARTDTRTLAGIPVRVAGTDLEARMTPPTVTLELEGPVTVLSRLSAATLSAVVELSETEAGRPGRHVKPFRVDGLPPNVKPIEFRPAEVKVRLLRASP